MFLVGLMVPDLGQGKVTLLAGGGRKVVMNRKIKSPSSVRLEVTQEAISITT
jgi:tRNA A37 threonylcarbamoyladenosine biosynthesis protein TsaE